jgi:ribosome-associated toxin RatA of RatAB toxin-antitoxin module
MIRRPFPARSHVSLRAPMPVRHGVAAAVLGAWFLVAASAGPARAEEATGRERLAALRDRIELGNVPAAESGVEWGRAEGVLRARPEAVLRILQDYGRYAGLFPYFEKSRVLSQRGSDAIVYLEAKILHGLTTLWGQVRMSAKSADQDTQVVEAKLMRGKGNMSQLLARWEVTPAFDGTQSHVVFQLLVDPDLPVPDSIVSHEMRNSAGQALRALRRRLLDARAPAQTPAEGRASLVPASVRPL